MDKNTYLAIGAVIIATATAGGVIIDDDKEDPKTFLAATVSENDVEVADIMKAAEGLKPVRCVKQKFILDGQNAIGWICSDVGYDSKRQVVLDKRAGEKGVIVEYTPTPKIGDNVGVDIKITEGEIK